MDNSETLNLLEKQVAVLARKVEKLKNLEKPLNNVPTNNRDVLILMNEHIDPRLNNWMRAFWDGTTWQIHSSLHDYGPISSYGTVIKWQELPEKF